MAKGKTDPNARRQGESQWAWRARLAAQAEAERTKHDKPVTAETLRQGGLVAGFVVDEDGCMKDTFRRVTRSALQYMNNRGTLSDEQYYSALQIARVAERIERSAGTSCASLEARVDCSGSASDALTETLTTVRLERAYSVWRQRLPIPRRMVIDMVTRDRRLAAIAQRHNVGWPKAQRLLRNALDLWPEIYAAQVRAIDQDDLDAIHSRLNKSRFNHEQKGLTQQCERATGINMRNCA